MDKCEAFFVVLDSNILRLISASDNQTEKINSQTKELESLSQEVSVQSEKAELQIQLMESVDNKVGLQSNQTEMLNNNFLLQSQKIDSLVKENKEIKEIIIQMQKLLIYGNIFLKEETFFN